MNTILSKTATTGFPLRGLWAYAVMCVTTMLYSIPCMLLAPFSRRAVHAIGRLYARQLLAAAGVSVIACGIENLVPGRPYTLLSNHQSEFDITALMAAAPLRLHFLAKKELFDIPFFGWGLRALGHIPIDRSNRRRALITFQQAGQTVREDAGMSLVIFPEGTRSEDGQLRPFKQGSFTLVQEAGLPVVPVTIQGSREVLPKGRFFPFAGKITVRFGEPISLAVYGPGNKAALAQAVREKIQAMLAD